MMCHSPPPPLTHSELTHLLTEPPDIQQCKHLCAGTAAFLSSSMLVADRCSVCMYAAQTYASPRPALAPGSSAINQARVCPA
jgi:hypothetical protein